MIVGIYGDSSIKRIGELISKQPELPGLICNIKVSELARSHFTSITRAFFRIHSLPGKHKSPH